MGALCGHVTKQSIAAMLDSTATGTDLLKVIDLLPNSSSVVWALNYNECSY
jgi:hypothetical protein